MRIFINTLSLITALLVCITMFGIYGASTGASIKNPIEISSAPITKKTVFVFKNDTTISQVWIITTKYSK